MTKSKTPDADEASNETLGVSTPDTQTPPAPTMMSGGKNTPDPLLNDDIPQYEFYKRNPAFKAAVDRDQTALDPFRSTKANSKSSQNTNSPVECLQRMRKELISYASEPHPAEINVNVTYAPIEDDIQNILGSIAGPPGTPFEGGLFFVRIALPKSYPREPPEAVFLTRIFHPNISMEGHACLDVLDSKWSPSLTVMAILLSLSSLFDDPCAADPANDVAGSLYYNNPAAYDLKVRDYVKLYAAGDLPSQESLTRPMADFEDD